MDKKERAAHPHGSSAGHADGAHSTKDVEQNKDIAALGYVWILSIFVYVAKRQSPFVRFHARQGIVLFLISILGWAIPFGIGKVVELLVLAGAVLGFLAAAQGEWKEVILVGPLARGDWEGVRHSWREIVKTIMVLWKGILKTVANEETQERKAHEYSHTPPASDPIVPPPPVP